jgi:hypothetical protein
MAAAVVVADHKTGMPVALRACHRQRLEELRKEARQSGAMYEDKMQHWKTIDRYAGGGEGEGVFNGVNTWPQRNFPGGIMKGLPQGSGPPNGTDLSAPCATGDALARAHSGSDVAAATSLGASSQGAQPSIKSGSASADATSDAGRSASAAQASRKRSAKQKGKKQGKAAQTGSMPRVDTSVLD